MLGAAELTLIEPARLLRLRLLLRRSRNVSRVRTVTLCHEQWIGEAKGGKAEKRNDDEKDFPEGKWLNAD